MANITVKNIPNTLYVRLKKTAKQQHRSLNGQIIYLIEEGLGPSQSNPERVLETARRYRAMTSRFTLTDEILEKAKESGRK